MNITYHLFIQLEFYVDLLKIKIEMSNPVTMFILAHTFKNLRIGDI